jgi:hypothetical protein
LHPFRSYCLFSLARLAGDYYTSERAKGKEPTAHAFLRSLDDQDYPEQRKTLNQLFKNLGPTKIPTFLWTVGAIVPPWEEPAS